MSRIIEFAHYHEHQVGISEEIHVIERVLGLVDFGQQLQQPVHSICRLYVHEIKYLPQEFVDRSLALPLYNAPQKLTAGFLIFLQVTAQLFPAYPPFVAQYEAGQFEVVVVPKKLLEKGRGEFLLVVKCPDQTVFLVLRKRSL